MFLKYTGASSKTVTDRVGLLACLSKFVLAWVGGDHHPVTLLLINIKSQEEGYSGGKGGAKHSPAGGPRNYSADDATFIPEWLA